MCSDRIPPKPDMLYDTGHKPPDKRINELHVWISIDANGGEGMLSADLPLPFGTRHTPLMSSKREIAERMRPIAEHLQRTATTDARRIEIELRTFRQAEHG